MSGKGSAPRPFSVDNEKFASNWDAIFSKKKQPEPVIEEPVEQMPNPFIGTCGDPACPVCGVFTR